MNLENQANKLYVKKSLIAQAVGKAKPKMKRLFAQDIVALLKELNINDVANLPGNLSMQMTRLVVRNIVLGQNAGSTSDRPRQATLHSQTSSHHESQ